LLKAKAKDSEFVLEDTSRPRTKAKDNNTAGVPYIIQTCGQITTPLHSI